MTAHEPFDPLTRFAEIERLVSRIYYRFSHLFLTEPELRDFWWEMAREEEQHACILYACSAVIANPNRAWLRLVLTKPTQPVPTMSALGLMILTGGLLGIGLFVGIRRHRRAEAA